MAVTYSHPLATAPVADAFKELLEFNHASWRSRITAIETNVAKTETVVTFAVLEGDPAALE
eukprot:7011488-Prorocentrum_lima.AAC.1